MLGDGPHSWVFHDSQENSPFISSNSVLTHGLCYPNSKKHSSAELHRCLNWPKRPSNVINILSPKVVSLSTQVHICTSYFFFHRWCPIKKPTNLTQLPVDSSIFHLSQKENRLALEKHSYLMYYDCCLDLETRQQTRSLQKSLKAGNKNVFWNSILIFISFLRACGIFPGCNSACLVKEAFSLCV